MCINGWHLCEGGCWVGYRPLTLLKTSCPSMTTNSLSLDFQKHPSLDNIISLLCFIKKKNQNYSLSLPHIIILWYFNLRDEIRVLRHDNKPICWDVSEFIFTHTFFPPACSTVDPAFVLTWFQTYLGIQMGYWFGEAFLFAHMPGVCINSPVLQEFLYKHTGSFLLTPSLPLKAESEHILTERENTIPIVWCISHDLQLNWTWVKRAREENQDTSVVRRSPRAEWDFLCL